MADLADHVTQDPETGQFTFVCPGDPTDPCGSPGVHTFFSAGWPTAEVAAARGAQHIAAHVHKTMMPSVADFRAAMGLAEPENPVASSADLSVYLPPEE